MGINACLAEPNDDCRTRHESGNDSVGNEVGDPAQVQQPDQCVHDTSNERNLQSPFNFKQRNKGTG